MSEAKYKALTKERRAKQDDLKEAIKDVIFSDQTLGHAEIIEVLNEVANIHLVWLVANDRRRVEAGQELYKVDLRP